MILENQLTFLRKFPNDLYGYYDQNGDRLFFNSIEDALKFENKILMELSKKFR